MNFDSIFDIKSANLAADDTTKKESSFYSVSADKGVDNVYTSYIRFIPNIHDLGGKSIIQKYVNYLENPDTNEKRQVDCPSTLGDPKKHPSLLQETFFALWNSKNAHEHELRKKFSRVDTYYSLVYIVSDPQQPHLNGKIKIFKFGSQIGEILKAADKPDEDEGKTIDYLNLFEGKTFKLVVIKKSDNNNYQTSKFLGKSNPIVIDGEEMTDTPKNRKIMMEWLKTNSPDLSEFKYKPWDEDTRKYVIDCIKATLPAGKLISSIFKKTGEDINSITETVAKKTKKPIVEEFDDDDEEDVPVKPKSIKNIAKDDFGMDDDDLDAILAPSKFKKAKPVVDEDEDEDFFV